MTTISRLLRLIRLQHGEVLLDMAQKIGVTSAFLSAVENGRKPALRTWLKKLSALYALSDEQLHELEEAFNENIKQIRISLESAHADKRDLALSFARRFDELDGDEVAAVMQILNKKQHKEEMNGDT